MATVNLIMPKMGESVAEATIIKWVKQVGDTVELDETIVEIATDKVDSEIPSVTKGILIEQLYRENDIVKVGEVIAIIDDGKEENREAKEDEKKKQDEEENEGDETIKEFLERADEQGPWPKEYDKIHTVGGLSNDKEGSFMKFQKKQNQNDNIYEEENVFYSPLVKNIAKKENISKTELSQIKGTGHNGRVTKKNILDYIKNRESVTPIKTETNLNHHQNNSNYSTENVEVIEMDRMRKLIAKHMITSKATSAHVTSFVEVDVTKLVKWREKIKEKFLSRENQKITYTPIIFEAVVKAIIDFPLINISVEHENIIKHKNIHLGMATALKNGNLIVPVIKHAQDKNLLGLTKSVNDLAERARSNQLKPDEVSGGTFTITNVGSFGSVMGTPIINQPQVAILAVGKIQKKPTVLETEFGDVIAIRSKMFLSLSYDHRVVDGALGGMFLKRISDYLEDFDIDREI